MLEWYQSTLPWRVSFGVAVFAILAFVDWRRNPEHPRRVFEYAFLVYGMACACLYGVAHDQITVTLSPEYFVVFKGLDPGDLRFEALKLSVLATYWVGLVISAALLVANNPLVGRPQLAYSRLRRLAIVPVIAGAIGAGCGAVVLGGMGTGRHVMAWTGYLPVDATSFLVVWGIHIGSYAGGALGGLAAVVRVRVERRRGG